MKVPPVKAIVSERLQPWPEAMGSQLGTLLSFFEGLINNFIGVLDGPSISRYSISKSRRVKHGRQIIQMEREGIQPLADESVIEIPANVAEDVCGQEDIISRSLRLASLRNSDTALTRFSSTLAWKIGAPRRQENGHSRTGSHQTRAARLPRQSGCCNPILLF